MSCGRDGDGAWFDHRGIVRPFGFGFEIRRARRKSEFQVA